MIRWSGLTANGREVCESRSEAQGGSYERGDGRGGHSDAMFQSTENQLAGPMETGLDKAVICTTNGKEESHFVRPVARSKVASVPVVVDAVFLIDELDKVVDGTYGNMEAVHRAAELWQKKTPLKGNLSRMVGVVLKPLADNSNTIRTEGGTEHSYHVRPLIQPRLAKLSKGDAAVLLVDDENKVTDVAFVPTK